MDNRPSGAKGRYPYRNHRTVAEIDSSQQMPHGTAFAVLIVTAALLVLAALFPTVAEGVAFIGLVGSLGMIDRARDKVLWSWAAVMFGAALCLALAVSWYA